MKCVSHSDEIISSKQGGIKQLGTSLLLSISINNRAWQRSTDRQLISALILPEQSVIMASKDISGCLLILCYYFSSAILQMVFFTSMGGPENKNFPMSEMINFHRGNMGHFEYFVRWATALYKITACGQSDMTILLCFRQPALN